MPSQSRHLLDQLSDLQRTLEGFSFDQLSSAQALDLKRSFDTFRQQLEGRIWSPESIGMDFSLPKPSEPPGIPGQESQTESSDELIALVSHEIRTPLSGIVGFADLLREGFLDAQQQKHADAILAASGAMLEMVNALLDYHKTRKGVDPPAEVSFAPAQVLEEVRYLSETLILDTRLTFDFQVAGPLPNYLIGDPSRFSQILMNLLGNAIKFTKEGRIYCTVKSVVNQNTCEIFCEVGDTGPGIPESELKKIFLPYKKARNQKRISGEGLGLGLSLVNQWAKQMGGTVSVKSRVGQGSTFDLRLPFAIGAKQPQAERKAPPSDVSILRGKHILIFEDNPLNMKLAEARLKGWGCRVYQALHYQRGLQYLETETIDLVLMDLRMPGMDGYAVSKTIREHADERIRALPVVALTADFTPEVEARIKACGIGDLVVKPYTPEALSKALIRGLREAKNHRAAETCPERAGFQPVLSLERLWEDCNRDYDMLEEMVRLFQNGVLEFLGALSIHSKSPDYREIREAAHKVKAGLKLLQATAWLERIEQIQDLARSKTGAAKIRGHFESLSADFPRLEAVLWKQLNQFKPGA